MSDDVLDDDQEKGSPAWVMTFADLMSLLMCFFVLLLSFSEMDLEKYKQVAGSMKFAFGVQREIEAKMPPKGTSVIAQEFSPGRPQPTPIREIRQSTVDDLKQTIEFTDALVDEDRESEVARESQDATSSDDEFRQDEMDAEHLRDAGAGELEPTELEAEQLQAEARTQANADRLLEAFREEIIAGIMQVETAGTRILIRIKEKASFPSGAATLRADFQPVLVKLREQLVHVPGRVHVAGHTDNVPIHTRRFRSNWDLSAARAVSVVHELVGSGKLQRDRFVAEGYGDSRPLVANDSAENRAINRRVEIVISQQPATPDALLEELQPQISVDREADLLSPDSVSELETELRATEPEPEEP